MNKTITIELDKLFQDTTTAKIENLPKYLEKVEKLVGDGNIVVITGPAPIWLYLKVAHLLHGKAKKLIYRSPITGDIIIFDHNPF